MTWVRTLLFAGLALWGCLWTMRLTIHPVPRNGNAGPSAPGGMRIDYYQEGPLSTARGVGIDYYQFWMVGRVRERLEIGDIYSPQARQQMADLGRELLTLEPSERLAHSVASRGRILDTFSTPFLYAVIDFFASGHYDPDYDHFMDLCLAALVFATLAMGWSLRFSWAEVLLFATVLVLWSEPLASDLRVGNVNQLQLAGVALYLLCCSQPENRLLQICSGLMLGLLVAFKPTLGVIPLLLTLSWLIDRRWDTLLRQGISAVAAAGVALVVGCRFLGSWSAWLNWAHVLSELERVSNISVDNGNYSLSEVLREATGEAAGGGISLALLLLMLGVVGIALYLTRPSKHSEPIDRQIWIDRDFLVTAMGCALSVVALKLVWLHYYVLIIPLALYVLRPGAWVGLAPAASDRTRLLLVLARLVVALLALAAVLGQPYDFLVEPGGASSVSLYIGGAWVLLLLGVTDLWVPALGSQSAKTARGQ